jgi:6,7-dimethyl-8-ribityllumazine synthase
MKIIQGNLTIKDKKIALVAGRFNSFVVEHLISGAKDTLVRSGADENDISLIYTPGAFEIPLAVKKLALSGKYDVIVALGAVIRGATPHFEYVAGQCAKGISQVMLEFNVPITFGILTTDTVEQAIERSGSKAGNKGADAAIGAIEMVNLLEQI